METPQSPPFVEGQSTLIPRRYVIAFRRRKFPTDITEMLSERYQQVVFDGFTADLVAENPYGSGVNKSDVERFSHALWNRGRAYRVAGKSLKNALLVEE